MAISPVIPETVQIRLLWSLSANGAINVLHAKATAGTVVNQTLANTVGAAIKAAFTANLAPHIASGSGLVRVGVRDLRTPNAAEFLDSGTTVVGTGVGDPLPANVALCTTLRTAKAGASFRGRVYLGGYVETANDANGLAAAAAGTASVAFVGAIQTALSGSQLTLAVASRPSERYVITKTTYHADGTSSVKTMIDSSFRAGGSEPVTSISSRGAGWESQRRRNNGRGSLPTMLTAVATFTVEDSQLRTGQGTPARSSTKS